MLTDRLAELIARSLSGEATSEELEELEAHMLSHPGDQYFRDILISFWNSRGENNLKDDLSSDQHFKYILALADEKAASQNDNSGADIREMDPIPERQRISWIRRIGVAAVIGGVIVGAVFLIPRSLKPSLAESPVQNEQISKKGARTKLVLPDGSQVWLNSETKLLYPDKFSGATREVNLEGEAYFDVIKDSTRPFIVHTSGIDIHVKGTIFNVKSYEDEPTIETTLIQGVVEIVETKRPKAPHQFLSRHQKAIYLKTNNNIKERTIRPPTNNTGASAAIKVKMLPKNIADSLIRETYWVYNKLAFESEKFIGIARGMERWFNVKIDFKDAELESLDLHISFEHGEPIEQAMKELQLIAPIVYTKTGNQIEIAKKK